MRGRDAWLRDPEREDDEPYFRFLRGVKGPRDGDILLCLTHAPYAPEGEPAMAELAER